MDLDKIKRGLRAEIKKRENEQYFTFQCNVRQMCKDVLAKLEYQESEIAEKDAENRRLKRALWLARAWLCGRSSEYFSGMASRCKIGQEDFYREVSERARRYMKSSYKCRAKAEEYK